MRSLVDRINYETRTIGGVPWQPWKNPYWRFNIGGPVHPSREIYGQETVLGLAALYASVRFIADQIASLPVKVYRRLPDGTSQRVFSSMLLGDEISPSSGPQVPGEQYYDWFFSGSASALLHGTAWGYVTNRSGIPGADGQGLPTGVAWLPPERMNVMEDEMHPENPLRARIYYNGHQVDRSELVIMKAFSVAGRVDGISPMRAFASLYSQGLHELDYSATWFENGGFPPGAFRNINETVTEQQSKVIRRELTDTIRMRQPLVFGADWEYTPILVPPDEATFVKSMQLNATQVAAVYGVQPWRVGGTRADGLTYSNVTMNQLDELQTTLRPWLRRWEHLLTSMLPATQYAKFDVDEYLRMDPHTRNTVYQIQRNMGTRLINEIREEDDKQPLKPLGDDSIPQGVLERMAATTRTIPKSMLPLIVFEADHIAKTLETMEQEHPDLLNPMTADRPPLQSTPEQYLGRLMTQVRSGPIFGPPEGTAQDSDRESAITMLEAFQKLGKLDAEEARARIARAKSAETCGQLAELMADMPHLYGGMAAKALGEGAVAHRQSFGLQNDRASHDDRKAAINLLGQHALDGRLQQREFEDRAHKASEAVTCGDLATLFSDLPVIEMAASPPVEDRVKDDQPLFGPAALALLHERAMNDEVAELAATNGKAH